MQCISKKKEQRKITHTHTHHGLTSNLPAASGLTEFRAPRSNPPGMYRSADRLCGRRQRTWALSRLGGTTSFSDRGAEARADPTTGGRGAGTGPPSHRLRAALADGTLSEHLRWRRHLNTRSQRHEAGTGGGGAGRAKADGACRGPRRGHGGRAARPARGTLWVGHSLSHAWSTPPVAGPRGLRPHGSPSLRPAERVGFPGWPGTRLAAPGGGRADARADARAAHTPLCIAPPALQAARPVPVTGPGRNILFSSHDFDAVTSHFSHPEPTFEHLNTAVQTLSLQVRSGQLFNSVVNHLEAWDAKPWSQDRKRKDRLWWPSEQCWPLHVWEREGQSVTGEGTTPL